MNVFAFQKELNLNCCEDAPPISNECFSIVCDGLGGAGAKKYMVDFYGTGETENRTSAYMGSRIVSSAVNSYFEQYARETIDEVNLLYPECMATVETFVGGLKDAIQQDLENNLEKFGIEPSKSLATPTFPTTLASAIYADTNNKLKVLCVWAGDSRVYFLSPTKGLLLLTLDDAKGAETEMNSVSEMTNKIAVRNGFRLNYSIHELEEEGILFCCSDGCFDYMKSPLHLEYNILYALLNCMNDEDGDSLGSIFSKGICNNLYKSIGDDTTMAGVIVGIEDLSNMKTLFQPRMEQISSKALDMNTLLLSSKEYKDKKEKAQKGYRLSKNATIELVSAEITDAVLNPSSNETLCSYLSNIDFFVEFTKNLHHEIDEIKKSTDLELDVYQNRANQMRMDCEKMLMRDYMTLQRSIRPTEISLNFATSERVKQYLMTCMEMYDHSEYKSIVLSKNITYRSFDEDIQRHKESIQDVLRILDCADNMFEELLIHAYFSTDNFSDERHDYEQREEYHEWVNKAFEHPDKCKGISLMARNKIKDYNRCLNEIEAVKKNAEEAYAKEIKSAVERFLEENIDKFFNIIISADECDIYSMFADSLVPVEKIVACKNATDEIRECEKRILVKEDAKVQIWDEYKIDYQAFNYSDVKGVI